MKFVAASHCLSLLLLCPLFGCEDDSARDGSGASQGLDGGFSPGNGRLDSGADAMRDAASLDAADAASMLREAEVMAFALALNGSQVEAGELASTHATDATVRAYAERVASVHSEATVRLRALAVAPINGPEQAAYLQMTTQLLVVLRGAEPGADFDRLYVRTQRSLLETALVALDQRLLPSALSPGLATELARLRAELAQDLEQARAFAL